MTRHLFLQPALEDPFYHCGGWQIFNRTAELARSAGRPAEIVTYRLREDGHRFLDDVPVEELAESFVWIYWSTHLQELSERLPESARVVFYAMNTDYGEAAGQVTPMRWPVVALSRYIAADHAFREPGRQVLHLPPALHPDAMAPLGERSERDIDVLCHPRKSPPYLRHELLPALEARDDLTVKVIDSWIPQEEFLALLGRTRVYLYWVHQQIPPLWLLEGFGMQPLEAVACGALPVSNFYGGLGDYLEAPWNCVKIGVHSLDYDVERIARAAKDHQGPNRDAERIRHQYGEEMFERRLALIEDELDLYFRLRRESPAGEFDIQPPVSPLWQRLYGRFVRFRKRLQGVRPR
jgi:hypothetical protein